MKENAVKFIEILSADETLKAELAERLKGSEGAAQYAATADFAKEKGYDLAPADFLADGEELDDSELAAVAGGGGCGCAVGGGGGGDGIVCFCIVGGFGNVEDLPLSSQGGCYCPVAGAGATNRH